MNGLLNSLCTSEWLFEYDYFKICVFWIFWRC